MFKADYHIHSNKSFDAAPQTSIESILKTSVDRGINEIILCDHYDVNWVISGENPDIDFQDSLNQINAAKEKYNVGRGDPDAPLANTEFLLGIELGQPNQYPEKAAEVLENNDFDFILCALHNARNEQDFYYIDYKNINILNLIKIFEKYTNELCELASWGNFHSLAHITYPVRYFLLNNIHIPMEKYNDLYKKLFQILIHRGIALEVNTSGLRKKINQASPPYDLLKLYKETGGELLTIGSDAHNATDIFSGIPYIYERLPALGFKYISVIKDKKLIQRKIEI
ncbi:MAG: histidinol-phosphatase HisJ family protein [Oscillospiraceae bacterium]|nr:histidinol-phosphatase HisJ family protein [Oscillospiraceae bacterium]